VLTADLPEAEMPAPGAGKLGLASEWNHAQVA